MQPGSCLVLDLVLLIMLAGCQLVIYRYPPHIFGVGGWVLGVLCITLCITQKRLLMMMMMMPHATLRGCMACTSAGGGRVRR